MKKKSHITVVIATAIITFGILFAVKGGMNRHHWQNHSEQCSHVSQEEGENNFQFNKSDKENKEGLNK